MKVFEIRSDEDVVRARQAARTTAEKLGFSIVNKTRIATAVSELARNVYKHGGGGRMEIEEIREGEKAGIHCIFTDQGPGIPDIEQAMSDGFSTAHGLGQGLPGSKRLMDNLKVESQMGKGTRVEIVKWK